MGSKNSILIAYSAQEKYVPSPRTFMVISNIWAVGRNYSDHAKEMGSPVPAEPMIFLKAGSSAVCGDFHLPKFSQDVHHELEIAFQLDSNLKPYRYTLSLDLTARDLQAKLKEKGHPWTLAKSFKESCVLGPWLPLSSLEDLQNTVFSLTVNGTLKQKGHGKDMIFSPQVILDYIAARFPIVPGDVILTGTPAGVGPLKIGDRLVAEVPGSLKIEWGVLP